MKNNEKEVEITLQNEIKFEDSLKLLDSYKDVKCYLQPKDKNDESICIVCVIMKIIRLNKTRIKIHKFVLI